MFIVLNTLRLRTLRRFLAFAGTVAVLTQLSAADGLACSTMDMSEDAEAHAMANSHGADHGSSVADESDEHPGGEGLCEMMVHCTAPAVALHPASLDARTAMRVQDVHLPFALLASASSRTAVPPPRT